MNDPFIVAIIALLLLALLVFINIKNKEDRRKLEQKLNNNYRKPRDKEGEVNTDLNQD